MGYHRYYKVDTRLVRIFNTYGPRLQSSDGRVISNLMTQALHGEDLTIYGDGSQTRSFCYVDDLVRGLVAMLDSASAGPVNLGNPVEHNMVALAELILELTESKSEVVTRPLPVDDPTRRRPDISLAREVLGWAPTTQLRDGLCRTIEWFRASPGPAVRTG
jgi:nucleoside-diphosphate-sugar epimerase